MSSSSTLPVQQGVQLDQSLSCLQYPCLIDRYGLHRFEQLPIDLGPLGAKRRR